MKNFSIMPTEENALKLLHENPIGRNNSVFRFIKLIDALEGNCSIALNGEWGSGKTMFIKQAKLLMDFNNPYSSLQKELRDDFGTLARIPCYESYSTVYYDAWENDKHEDPLLSLIYATICSNQSQFSVDKNRSLFQLLGTVAETISGHSVTDLLDQLQGDDPLAAIRQSDDISSLVQEFIDSLMVEKGNRLVVFIDELDRCRPTYAVQLLERIKHYFCDDRITFVFSVNLSQLQHTVKSYYGPSFDATRYLDKFFDLRVAIPPVDYDRFFDYRFSFVKSGYIYDEMCIRVIQHFSFSLRETERYLQLMKIAAYQPTHQSHEPYHRSGNALRFATLYFLPIMIGLNMADLDGYRKFVLGENTDILHIFLDNVADFMRLDLLGISNQIANTREEAKNSIQDIYRTLFSPGSFNEKHELVVGKMMFTKETRCEIMEIASLLSSCSDYEIEI